MTSGPAGEFLHHLVDDSSTFSGSDSHLQVVEVDGIPAIVVLSTDESQRAIRMARRTGMSLIVVDTGDSGLGGVRLAAELKLFADETPRGALIVVAAGPVSAPMAVQLAVADLSVAVHDVTGISLDCSRSEPALAAADVAAFIRLIHSAQLAASEPSDDAVSLTTVVSPSAQEPYAAEDVISALLDDGTWLELGGAMSPQVSCGVGRVGGWTAGFAVSRPALQEGAISGAAAAKLLRLVRLCEAHRLPLVWILDSRGLVFEEPNLGTVNALSRLIACMHEPPTATVIVLVGRAHGLSAAISGLVGSKRLVAIAWPRAQLALAPMDGTGDEDDGPPTYPSGPHPSVLDAARQGMLLEMIEPDETRRTVIDILDLFSVTRPRTPASSLTEMATR